MIICICDDDPDSLHQLAGTVRQNLLDRGWAWSICCFERADQLFPVWDHGSYRAVLAW